MRRRLGDDEENILGLQSNLANSYQVLGKLKEALRMRQDVYSGRLKLNGEEDRLTLASALNYASTLCELRRFEEVKSLMRKTMCVAQRVLGEANDLTLKMKKLYAEVLFSDDAATLDDLHEAVTTLEDSERIARRVLGGSHPRTTGTERQLRYARATLRAHAAARIGRTFQTIWRRREKLATVEDE